MLAWLAAALLASAPTYFWIEAERMHGVAGHWPSWNDAQPAPGWHWNGPGVSAEWGQGGESGFNSIACGPAADAQAVARERIVLPRAARYRVWVRLGEWASGRAPVGVRLSQRGHAHIEGEVGAAATLDPQDEALAYW